MERMPLVSPYTAALAYKLFQETILAAIYRSAVTIIAVWTANNVVILPAAFMTRYLKQVALSMIFKPVQVWLGLRTPFSLSQFK